MKIQKELTERDGRGREKNLTKSHSFIYFSSMCSQCTTHCFLIMGEMAYTEVKNSSLLRNIGGFQSICQMLLHYVFESHICSTRLCLLYRILHKSENKFGE